MSANMIVKLDTAATRSISISVTECFKAVGKILAKIGVGSYGDALTEVPDLLSALDIRATTEERVRILLVRALERALLSLLKDAQLDVDGEYINVHAATFTGITSEITVEINEAFFAHPDKAEFLSLLALDAQRWLNLLGVPDHDSLNIVDRVPTVFAISLHDEWRSRADYYNEIIDEASSPFAGAATFATEWTRYQSYLMSSVDEKVFDESFGLRQIYVPLRAYFHDKKQSRRRITRYGDSEVSIDEPVRKVHWLRDEISAWIKEADKDFALRAITGGPGSGKSSCARMIAADLAAQGQKVLFVPLHQVDLDTGLTRSLVDFFKETGHFLSSPFDGNSSTLLLILDGLDEIQMQGKAAQDSALAFVDEVNRFVDRRNSTKCNVLCLITGRDLAIQSAEGVLRREGQVLHLLPYFIDKEEHYLYEDANKLVELDQRIGWWNTYYSLSGRSQIEMPEALKRGELNEVTSQPLLNYLVALAYRSGMEIGAQTNVNEVYSYLLAAVYDRGWAKNNHPSVANVPLDAFARLLEEVALSVWHGAGRTTTLGEVEAHCEQNKVAAYLSAFQSGVSSGISSLLLAFYFRQKGRRDGSQEKTFEFTHKSFAEYLITLRVVRLIDLLTKQLDSHRSDADQGWSYDEALFRWLSICGKTPIDVYLIAFLRRELALRGSDSVARYQDALIALMNASLASNWPVNRMERTTFAEQQVIVRNAEETLLACLNACARVSKKPSLINWPTETTAGDMIRRLQGQRRGPNNKPVMTCLSYTNFANQKMDIIDLYNADLKHSILDRVHLNYANLMQADLSGASLLNARIEGVYFSGTKLDGLKLNIGTLKHVAQMRLRNRIVSSGVSHVPATLTRLKRQYITLRQRGVILANSRGNPMTEEEIGKALDRIKK